MSNNSQEHITINLTITQLVTVFDIIHQEVLDLETRAGAGGYHEQRINKLRQIMDIIQVAHIDKRGEPITRG